jgi:hypothetical protein
MKLLNKSLIVSSILIVFIGLSTSSFAQCTSFTKKQGFPALEPFTHAKEYGFIFPSSEIYDGLSAVYDYAQNGCRIKKNIKNIGGKQWCKCTKIL